MKDSAVFPTASAILVILTFLWRTLSI